MALYPRVPDHGTCAEGVSQVLIRVGPALPETAQSGDSSELASRLPCKGKSVRNRGVSQTMPFLVIPRSLLRGGFIALFGTTITSKAFSNPVAKPHCADVARTMTERLIGEMTLQVLGCATGHPCGELRRLILQDGSSFAIHDGLREVLPGRCTTVKPAAVALHTTMDLLCDAPTTVLLTPDTTNAPAFWPEPATLTGALLLADRGSIDVHSRRRVQDAGGGCLIRANAGMNPQILEALREDGQRLRSLRQKSLQTIRATRPTRQRVARVVQGQGDR